MLIKAAVLFSCSHFFVGLQGATAVRFPHAWQSLNFTHAWQSLNFTRAWHLLNVHMHDSHWTLHMLDIPWTLHMHDIHWTLHEIYWTLHIHDIPWTLYIYDIYWEFFASLPDQYSSCMFTSHSHVIELYIRMAFIERVHAWQSVKFTHA